MKKPIKIAINGLGRIGRVFLRIAWGNPNFEIVSANSRSDLSVYTHLLKYDSVYGIWGKDVKIKKGNLVIDGKEIKFFQEKEAEKLPWNIIKPDLVVEATGKYRKIEEAENHIASGARYVLITAPVDGPGTTLVRGINEQSFDPKADKVISAASCTSICSSLVVKVLEENFGVEHGFINTVHAFTQDQNLQDGSHKDLRRARAASMSIIPTSTGVTKTIDKLFPALRGKMSGLAYRVPIPDPSVLSITARLKKTVDAKVVNQVFKRASEGTLKGQLAVSEEPLVSVDYKQNPLGATIDLLSTDVVDGKLVNVVAWYDNEWGYVTQVVSLLEYLVAKM